MSDGDSHTAWVNQAAFIGALCLAVPSLRPLLGENSRGRRREILPDSFMFELSKRLVGRVRENGIDDPEVREVLDYCESHYGSDDPSIDNLIAVSFVEMFLSDGEIGWKIMDSFGPQLTKALHSVIPTPEELKRRQFQGGKVQTGRARKSDRKHGR